jgi:carbon storage regulator CsrA
MLNLERKLNQKIMLDTSDGQITIMVTLIEHGRVKLGIDAPDSVHIRRSELIDRRATV